MWPFRRKPAKPDVDLGRTELSESQLESTMQYGWRDSDPDSTAVVLEYHDRPAEDLSQRVKRESDENENEGEGD
jgi:hypothetical protein